MIGKEENLFKTQLHKWLNDYEYSGSKENIMYRHENVDKIRHMNESIVEK